MTADTSELWVVAWRIHGREKQQTFGHKEEAAQLARDLLVTDCDLVVLSREVVRVRLTVSTVKPAKDEGVADAPQRSDNRP